jgi:DNA-binding transcriptional MerR regulator
MLEPSNNAQLPEIPSKRYFTIGEVSDLCDVKPHVLRYWEQEFPQLKPVKRRGNRRYYQRQDVLVIRTIRSLLYEQGYTIGGARLQLTDAKPEKELVVAAASAPAALLGNGLDDGGNMLQVVLKDMIKELEQVATLLAR